MDTLEPHHRHALERLSALREQARLERLTAGPSLRRRFARLLRALAQRLEREEAWTQREGLLIRSLP